MGGHPPPYVYNKPTTIFTTPKVFIMQLNQQQKLMLATLEIPTIIMHPYSDIKLKGGVVMREDDFREFLKEESISIAELKESTLFNGIKSIVEKIVGDAGYVIIENNYLIADFKEWVAHGGYLSINEQVPKYFCSIRLPNHVPYNSYYIAFYMVEDDKLYVFTNQDAFYHDQYI